MLPALAVAVGLVWFFADQAKKSNAEPKPKPEPKPEDDREDDQGGIVEFDEITRWSGEEVVGDSVVWEYTTGICLEDGTENFDSPYIVIGDAAHHNFLRTNSNRGTIDISKERTGGSTDQKNVKVFSSITEAVSYLEEKEDEDDDPTGPQPQPEPEPPAPPSKPVQPDYGLGGGGASLFSNGGI